MVSTSLMAMAAVDRLVRGRVTLGTEATDCVRGSRQSKGRRGRVTAV